MLTPRSHRALDYVLVAVFLVAPFALRLDGSAEVVCYVLAGVHVALTVVTRFPVPDADERPVPLPVHGYVEMGVGVALLVAPWLVTAWSTTAKGFLAVMGVVILVVWRLTPYGPGDDAATADPGGAAGRRGPQPPPRP